MKSFDEVISVLKSGHKIPAVFHCVRCWLVAGNEVVKQSVDDDSVKIDARHLDLVGY